MKYSYWPKQARILFETAIIAKYPIIRERIKCASPIWALHSQFSNLTGCFNLLYFHEWTDWLAQSADGSYLHAISLLFVLLGFELSLVA